MSSDGEKALLCGNVASLSGLGSEFRFWRSDLFLSGWLACNLSEGVVGNMKDTNFDVKDATISFPLVAKALRWLTVDFGDGNKDAGSMALDKILSSLLGGFKIIPLLLCLDILIITNIMADADLYH
jgi:hypothetical protein